MSELDDLYQEVILDHNRRPRNFGPRPAAARRAEGFNPLCGDHLWVYLDTEGSRLASVGFEGSGCAISKASASLMTDAVSGRTVEETLGLFGDFHRMVTGQPLDDAQRLRLGTLAAFSGVSEFPVRVKCASLAWHTLKAAIEGTGQAISTE
jgi:nitrogen fixation NifU-like protein